MEDAASRRGRSRRMTATAISGGEVVRRGDCSGGGGEVLDSGGGGLNSCPDFFRTQQMDDSSDKIAGHGGVEAMGLRWWPDLGVGRSAANFLANSGELPAVVDGGRRWRMAGVVVSRGCQYVYSGVRKYCNKIIKKAGIYIKIMVCVPSQS